MTGCAHEDCQRQSGYPALCLHRPGANLYITTCIHGLDLRLYPRCYLCQPEAQGVRVGDDAGLRALLVKWRDAALDGDASMLGDLVDETNAALAASPAPTLPNCPYCGHPPLGEPCHVGEEAPAEDASPTNATLRTLDDALNSGDGTYKP